MATDAGTTGSTVSLGDDPVETSSPTRRADTSSDSLHPTANTTSPCARSRETPAEWTHTSGRSGGQSGVSSGRSGSGHSGSGEYTSARDSGDEDGGGGQPRLTLRPEIEGDEAVVRADCSPHPEGTETAGDLTVEFLLDDRDDIDADAVTRDGTALRFRWTRFRTALASTPLPSETTATACPTPSSLAATGAASRP